MPEMTAHKEGDPSFLHACAVEPLYKLHHDLRTKPAKKTIIIDPSLTAHIPVADLGEAPRELAPHPPPPRPTPQVLFLDQTEAQRAERKTFRDASPPLSQGLDDLAPPFLKVWICHCIQLHAVSYMPLHITRKRWVHPAKQ